MTAERCLVLILVTWAVCILLAWMCYRPKPRKVPNAMRQWLKDRHIPCDEDGVPINQGVPIPPQTCCACGTLAEMPVVGLMGCGPDTGRQVALCQDCHRRMYLDSDAFWAELRARQG